VVAQAAGRADDDVAALLQVRRSARGSMPPTQLATIVPAWA
jgi:hypothetical protein